MYVVQGHPSQTDVFQIYLKIIQKSIWFKAEQAKVNFKEIEFRILKNTTIIPETIETFLFVLGDPVYLPIYLAQK